MMVVMNKTVVSMIALFFFGMYSEQWRRQPENLVPLCKYQVIFKL